jgi:hypothetical protein
MRHLQFITTSMALAAVMGGAQPASAQYIHIKDFPKIFGAYAAGGECARFPRVIADASGIRIVTAVGAATFQHTDVTLGYNGQEDHATTVFTQGPGEGLIIQFENGELTTLGGERMGAAEQAVAAIADHGPMRRCGARAAVAPPPPAAPAPPRMRATAASTVAALEHVGAMTDPGFKAAYLRALGPLQREIWLIDMDGPGDQHVATVAGGPFLQVSTCKDRDCGDNSMLVLYRPRPRTLWGVVSVRGRKTLIGNPPTAIVPQLLRLFKAAWPAS